MFYGICERYTRQSRKYGKLRLSLEYYILVKFYFQEYEITGIVGKANITNSVNLFSKENKKKKEYII